MPTPKFAIVIVAYNRLASVKRLFESLIAASYHDDSVDLIFSIDYSGSSEVEEYAQSVAWPHGQKSIIAHRENLGLKNHVLLCGSYFSSYDQLCVLEDDLYVSPAFYSFSRAAVDHFSTWPEIGGISLYSHRWNPYVNQPYAPADDKYDIFLMGIASSWGQIWLRETWLEFMTWITDKSDEDLYSSEFPVEVSNWSKRSWLKYHNKFLSETGRYFVYPRQSLTTNFSDPGEHAIASTTKYQTSLLLSPIDKYRFPTSSAHALRYDSFFENEDLSVYLAIPAAELTVSLYGNRRRHAKYLLSTHILPYKAIKSFGLKLRPWDVNVIAGLEGNEIFLYDTSIPSPGTATRGFTNEATRFFYHTRLGDPRETIRAAIYLALLFIRFRASRLVKLLQKGR